MEDNSEEMWNLRKKKDEIYGHQLSSLFQDLRMLAKSNIQFYKNSVAPNSEKFYNVFVKLFDHLQLGIETGVLKIMSVAHKYDFDANLPSNGYRSFVKIIQKCCVHLVQLSRHISSKRSTVFFRSGHYSRELSAYVITLGQLRACLHYLFKLMSYCEQGVLFPDLEKLPQEQFREAESLMKDVESLSQECFYGRCLGFQYCESMQKPLMTVCIFMASFSDGYLSESSSLLMKVANSMIGGSRYVMDPDLRGRKIVEVTRNCDIKFCQAFWAMNENDVMHTLPLFACPPVQLDKNIVVPPEMFELPLADGSGSARITPPCAHTGPGPVNCRLISYELREGQETWKAHGVNAVQTDATKMLPRASGLLIHIHGGGFVAQSSASHEVYLRHWAKELRVPIFCIDYSLAPNQPFPRAFEESLFAYAWALRNVRALGSTGERICVCGDSAGGNLAISLCMRALSMGIRVPDGIQTTYGCQLVSYTPSPSRLMALMDPLLPLGIISRCLAAYAGVTEQTGVNAPMGASLTKQTLFDIDENPETVESPSTDVDIAREEHLQQQAREFQEQALRLQKQARELLEETQKLRIRSSSLNIENMTNSRNASLSPKKTIVSQTNPCPPVDQTISHEITMKDKSTENNEETLLSASQGNDNENQITNDNLGAMTSNLQKSVTDNTEDLVKETCDKTVEECDNTSEDKVKMGTVPVSISSNEHDISKNVAKHDSSADDNTTSPKSMDDDFSSKLDDRSVTPLLDHGNQEEKTPDQKFLDSGVVYGHKVTGSGDSGFHDFVTKSSDNHENDADDKQRIESSPPNASRFSELTVDVATGIDTVASLTKPQSDTDLENSFKPAESGATHKKDLRLNLADCKKLPKKSDSTPNFLEISGEVISPRSPREFYTPRTSPRLSPNLPNELSTPSYAKVRHIAQSPVEQLTRLPMSNNPYMSPYLAEDALLASFPPVYFVCCELDPMLDDSIQMAKRLRDLGNEVHMDILADLPHGFLNFSLISHEAKQGSELVVRRIKQILDTDDEGLYTSCDVVGEDFEILSLNST